MYYINIYEMDEFISLHLFPFFLAGSYEGHGGL